VTTEGAYCASQLERLVRLLVREIADLPDAKLNEVLGIQPTNTLFQLGTHVAGSARYWCITCTGGRDYHRDRDSEFTARGSCGEVVENLGTLIEEINTHVTGLTGADLDRPVTVTGASFSGFDFQGELPQRHALLHALEHTGLHLGHAQLTRQILGFPPPALAED
jgi:hypothetical protein